MASKCRFCGRINTFYFENDYDCNRIEMQVIIYQKDLNGELARVTMNEMLKTFEGKDKHNTPNLVGYV